MRVVSAVVPVRPAPACTVRASPGEIAAELTAHVLIMPVTVAIVAVDPHVPPAVAMMPRRSMPAYPMRMATVLDPTGAPLARAGLDFAAVDFDRRRRCVLFGWLPGARIRRCLSYNGRDGQSEKRNEGELSQNFAHGRFPCSKCESKPSTTRMSGVVTVKLPTWLQKWPLVPRAVHMMRAKPDEVSPQARLFRRCGRLTSRLGMLIG